VVARREDEQKESGREEMRNSRGRGGLVIWKKTDWFSAAPRSLKAHSYIQSAVEGTLWADSVNPEPGLSTIPLSHSRLCTGGVCFVLCLPRPPHCVL